MDPHDPLLGRVLDGRYRIVRRIARGGMAGVYEAVDLRLERTVAVKVMHSGLGDGNDFAQRFVREARAAAQLSHPHVVAVYDQGEDAGTVFLAMEYVPGRTLRDVIRDEAPMPPLRALGLVEPVLGALAAAHRAGIVHRDVKPENVLIGEGGDSPTIKVADFGLAKAVSATSSHTATGVVIGTVSYLAPELVVQGQADARADVYAVGVLLYELLTGTKPHEGDSQIQVAYKHVHEDVPAPSARVPGLPAYVDALVARATARDRDQRPADAGVLLHQVRRVAQTLRDGVLDDPELEADLRPLPVVAPLPVELEADADGFADLESPVERTAVAAAPVGAAAARPTHDELPVSDRTQQIQLPPDETAVASAPGITRLPAPRPDLPREPRTRRRSRRGPILLLLALLLVVGVGVGSWWFGFARYTTTPSVLGMNRAEATAALEQAGLEVEVGDPSYSEDVPVDDVVATDPGPGDRVLPGETVTLSLSQGPERYDVPKLAGLSVDDAQRALEETKLEFGRQVDKYHDSVPEGQVISSNPKAGTTLRPGTAVNVVVSKGREPVELTDWTGKKAAAATKALRGAGLEVETEEVFDNDVAEGVVISQSPTTGTLYKGDAVKLVVSKGPELVQMPRVIAQGQQAAKERLEALGFTVKIERSGQYIGLGFVLSSDPGAGEMVPKGSTVTLFLI
ncbi:Stk1 family PASTA domain-containing Ser/Thr kinase [Nocardioides daphniae]|uniref:Stk1 family PASTA domain-containing Ser/Thr kinase n=1 Tax=Nocardioides daphniae TaxID=402297 RepID=UPI001E4B4B7E|nr:Stk1 family PASTA domain-containing Ser/Thr kinase [Nocardioides daphniae]